ncbi:MAG: hypothetical protein ACFNQF_06835 [Bacteroides sp.]
MVTKHLYTYIALALVILLAACEKHLKEEGREIEINGSEHLSEVAFSKLTTRTLLLSGGNGKYSASVADSRVASVKVSMDTMRITGHLEGETYATILSGDYKKRLDIRVVVPELSVSQDVVHLFPRDESKFLSVSGGGDETSLQINDPEQILQVNWNGRTGIMEINAIAEGDATITVVAQDGRKRDIQVVVRCKGTADEIGVYGTTSRTLYPIMNSVMMVQRPGVGVWLINNVNPYSSQRILKITPPVVQPKVGDVLTLTFGMRYPDEFTNSGLTEGKQQLIVEAVRSEHVLLRGHGFKLLIPYEK